MPDAGVVVDYNRFLYARGNPRRYNDPDGHRVKFPCPLCDQTLFDYSNQKGLADKAIDAVATVGCFFIGCHVDREANQVTGPSVEEAANAAVLGMINPIGMVNVPGAGEGLEQADGVLSKLDELLDTSNQHGPFHRLESPTQTPEIARVQETSGEIWGKAPRGSNIPKVQAYRGQLPDNARGIEFYTSVAPDSGTPPYRANWSGPRPGVRVEDKYAKICCTITKNTQR